MKNLFLFALAFCSLQFMSCSTTQSFSTPKYPQYTELHHGNYGESLYSTSTIRKQAILQTYYNYCDTAKPNYPKQTITTLLVASSATPSPVLLSLNQK